MHLVFHHLQLTQNPELGGESPATNHLSSGTASFGVRVTDSSRVKEPINADVENHISELAKLGTTVNCGWRGTAATERGQTQRIQWTLRFKIRTPQVKCPTQTWC